MKKDPFANYASAVFVQYAKLGRPTRADIEKDLTEQVFSRHFHKSRLEKAAILQKELEKYESKIQDMEAVNIMLDMLSGKIPIPENFKMKSANKLYIDITDVLENVYFKNHRYNLNANNLTLRVRRYAYSVPCDERTVWRSIQYAKRLFANIRGLSTDWCDEIKISNE